MIKNIGGLWKKSEDQKDKKYALKGNIEIDGVKTNIMLFKNEKKDKPTQPDYRIVTIVDDDAAAAPKTAAAPAVKSPSVDDVDF